MNPIGSGFIRSMLQIIGGALVAKGWLGADGVDSFVANMEMGIGGLAAAVGLAWSIWAKRPQSAEAVKIAEKVKEEG